MRLTNNANFIVESASRGVRVVRFVRPELWQYLYDDADAATSPLFREIHDAVLGDLPQGWTLVVNLGLVDTVNAAFYRCLLQVRKCVQARRGRVVLCGLTPCHQEIFELFRGPEVFTIVASERQACRKCRAARIAPEYRWQKSLGGPDSWRTFSAPCTGEGSSHVNGHIARRA